MFDFLFRRGNLTNSWERSASIELVAELDVPQLNKLNIGTKFDSCSFLGRCDEIQFNTYCYFDLGLGISHDEKESFNGYTLVQYDENHKYSPFKGEVFWKEKPLDLSKMSMDDLIPTFGKYYWLDTDDDESIAFYEFPNLELQIELTLSGKVKRFIVCNDAIMADPSTRKSYNVDKPWPPQQSS